MTSVMLFTPGKQNGSGTVAADKGPLVVEQGDSIQITSWWFTLFIPVT